MTMFTRRSLQGMLDHLVSHLPLEARAKLAHGLNRRSRAALGFEWETALLFGFSHFGTVAYEAQGPGVSRPDMTFVEAAEGPMRFTAEIATVSDESLDAQNPVTRLSLALIRLRQEHGLPGSTHYEIKREMQGAYRQDRKMRLKLPPGPRIEDFVKAHVGPIFKQVKEQNLPTASVTINEPSIEFTVSYDAKKRYGGGSYPSYTAVYSLTRNPVYAALKGKARQLKKAGLSGAFGIFLCDGDCTLLTNTRGHGDAVGLYQVVQEFFRQISSVSFVVILSIPPAPTSPFFGLVKKLPLTTRVYVNPGSKSMVDQNGLLSLLDRVLAVLPASSATPKDALYWIDNGETNQGELIHILSHGGSLMSRSLKVSARKVQELLAGQMTPEQFFSDYASPKNAFQNPFLRALKEGFAIQSVTFTPVPEADDDLIEFRFAPDPAVRKFSAEPK